MTSARQIRGYAEGLLSIAEAEGDLATTRAQLAAVARAVQENDELRSALSNNTLPVAVRGQIVDDVLANKTSTVTRGLVSMIVSAGRGKDLVDIVDAFAELSLGGSDGRIAVVRSAVPLSAAQQSRLGAALAGQLGHEVELDLVIDPTLQGGIVTTIGDTVIDGSLKTRLARMREAL